MRRLVNFAVAAMDEQDDTTAVVLTKAILDGDFQARYSRGLDGGLFFDLIAAGHHFLSVDARSVGVWEDAEGIVYHPDPILDDDLEVE